ncbi:uncharacterized protein LOC142976017 isoform X2 [Anticarsia gemmatalis]|uniref:uncharacterized protein LOC142976017 isoform X2 n=1 Tax=Anticarsia gemmatalis TaxID=129554 RepID=UPI003F7577AB
MCSFEKQMAILLYTILVVKSERWYSATIIERRDNETNSHADNYRTDYLQNSEDRFMPLLMMHPKETKNKRHDFKSTRDDLESNMNLNQNSIFKEPDAIVIRYNNTINNVNVLKRIRPKRKHIRKRCPPVNSRLAKQFKSKHPTRTRFLEVFQVVEFEHVVCTSSSGLEGTCLPEYECTEDVGSMMGTCADGYGTCCVTQFLCDSRSSPQTGWFTNPDFPSPSAERLSCAFALDKSSDDVTQIRLDFNAFELLPPTDGVCQDDQFIVSGQNVNNIIPILCGINTGQHVYVEVSDVDGPVYFTFQTASSESRLFSIKLTSSDELAVPSGCLQYYKDSQGYLESFNYRDKSDIVIARSPSYLNNLNYAMCIERAPETCSVTYTNVGNMQILNYDIDGLPTIPPDQAGVEVLNCPNDWLLIAAIRLCGDRLNDGSVFQDFTVNAPITDNSAGPIVVWFRSDESYVGTGFRLLYQQNSCSA